ncbi:hypothetical protein [Xanthomonas theicola]|nr:hypothetical protein [Xanthomonas theicola]QNH23625.1 hypothetical protein G4Q83_00985 [Xanthomonas theicola]
MSDKEHPGIRPMDDEATVFRMAITAEIQAASQWQSNDYRRRHHAVRQ